MACVAYELEGICPFIHAQRKVYVNHDGELAECFIKPKSLEIFEFFRLRKFAYVDFDERGIPYDSPF